MPTYAIGDVQGCFRPLMRLLERIQYDPLLDRIWLVGDIVNRGPDTLEVVRWVKAQGNRVVSVLGNHELHLLMRRHGMSRARSQDTLEPFLKAPDADELSDWLTHRPFVHRYGEHLMVHAGLLPDWTVETAESLARRAEAALVADPAGFLKRLERVPDLPAQGDATRVDDATAAAVMTRIRACRPNGWPDFSFKESPRKMRGLIPWFAVSERRWSGTVIIFGHWATLGFRMENHFIALDSGCGWGDCLTAVRLEDRKVFQVECK